MERHVFCSLKLEKGPKIKFQYFRLRNSNFLSPKFDARFYSKVILDSPPAAKKALTRKRRIFKKSTNIIDEVWPSLFNLIEVIVR